MENAIDFTETENLAGKIVIDITNPVADAPPVNGVLHYATTLENLLMERIKEKYRTRKW